MVGLVIVSHSRALAEALVQLMSQVSPVPIPVKVAAGIGDDRQMFGTDAVEISEAIQSVYSPDGVLVLMDLGSAVLSAEMALELLPPEMAGNIRFCPAPLVEGGIAASVQIGLGSDLDTVYREAAQSLQPKTEHLGVTPAMPAVVEQSASAADAMASTAETESAVQAATLTLHNQHGLHARPAARFVLTANKFQASIQVANVSTGKGPVSAASLNALASLGAVSGQQIRVTATGPQAQEALDALRQLVESNFGEAAEPKTPAPAESLAPTPPAAAPGETDVNPTWQAVPVSEGIALGPFYYYQPALPPIPQERAANIVQEKQRLQKAVERTRRAIEGRYQQMKGEVGEEQAAIFEAHLLILQDPELIERTNQRIETLQENAALAWSNAFQETASIYQNLPDAYQQQRAADVLDIGRQVLFALAGQASPAPVQFQEPVILFAKEITPTETAQLDMHQVLGILTEGGGPTSHSAILARALGIPAISGANPALTRVKPGTLVAINGFTGAILVDPSSEVQHNLQTRRQDWLDRRQQLIKTSQQIATTRDGRRVEVFANIGSLIDTRAAVENGAEGVGLLRTEFLYLAQETPPGEAEQLSALLEIGKVMGDRPVTVRTLDVGGDKALPYIHLAEEANPFLGVRAIRMSLHHPDLFMTQLRAILRAGNQFKVRIMFPMVATLEEVRQLSALLEKAHQALLAENLPHAWPVETGIMVEIPSAALISPLLAKEVDFFSIGTNDLTQYTMAAERGNPMLAGLADALHPAVLRLIKTVADAAHAAGKWVGVCGELAGDAKATAILVGLGVDELSLNPSGIPTIKATLRQVDTAQARNLAEQALQAACAEEVRQLS